MPKPRAPRRKKYTCTNRTRSSQTTHLYNSNDTHAAAEGNKNKTAWPRARLRWKPFRQKNGGKLPWNDNAQYPCAQQPYRQTTTCNLAGAKKSPHTNMPGANTRRGCFSFESWGVIPESAPYLPSAVSKLRHRRQLIFRHDVRSVLNSPHPELPVSWDH